MKLVFVDCDGTILDDEDLLFEKWRQIPGHEFLSEEEKIEYIKLSNWREILYNSKDINDALYILRHVDPKRYAILSRVNSLDNEGIAKIQFFKDKKIEVPVFIVPYTYKKTDFVDPRGNYIIDNTIRECKEWEAKGGIPLFFDKNGNNIDGWGVYNSDGFERVNSIRIK